MRRRVLGGLLGLAGLAGLAPATAACPGPALQPLGPGLWWWPAEPGDSDAHNRGHVAHLLLAQEGPRLWLLGSGPSPAFGQALRCQLQARWGPAPLVVISPWPQPESVLGVAGLGAVAHWAHAEVARQMAQRCAGCVARLQTRLGAAAGDLGPGDPVRLPDQLLHGAAGQLGPWRWWRLQRSPEVTVTVWWHVASGIAFAPGLLGDGRAPDGRDADLQDLAQATAALPALPGLPAPVRWLGAQGGLQDGDAPQLATAYWQALDLAVNQALDRGDSGEQTPATLPGVAAAVTAGPWHALNWQRAWRQAEPRWLQRSLR